MPYAKIAYAFAVADSRTVYRGLWWLPEDITDKQPGSLIIGPDNEVTLELVGGFAVTQHVPVEGSKGTYSLRHIGNWPMILGESGSFEFTLLQCRTTSAPGGVTGRPTEHIISAQRALRGNTHLVGIDDGGFGAMTMNVDYLLDWTAKSSLSYEHAPAGDEDVSTTAVSAPVTADSAEWNGTSFLLRIRHGGFYFETNDANSRSLSSVERAWIEVWPVNPLKLDEMDRMGKIIQDLLTLAMDFPCAVRAVNYKVPLPPAATPEEESQREYWADWNVVEFASQAYKPDPVPYENVRNTALFTLHNVGFAQIIPAWFNLYDTIETGVELLLGMRYQDKGYVTNKLLITCAALESLHASLYEKPPMAEAEHALFKSQALAGVEDPAHIALLKGRLGNTPGYKQRAVEMAEHVDPTALKTLIGDTDIWAKLIRDARNSLAHPSKKLGMSPGVRYYLMVLTRALLSLVIAGEIGLDANQQREFANVYWHASSIFRQLTGQKED